MRTRELQAPVMSEVSAPDQDASGAPIVSVVVPCFNEAEVLPMCISRLASAADSMRDIGARFEFILVDDGSSDNTFRIMQEATKDNRFRFVRLSRNFGHQLAVTAGIDASLGDAVVLIDCDLQDPPELIRDLIALWLAGSDVVYGVRRKRDGESSFKRRSAAAFYRLLNRISDVAIPLDSGDFRLISRRVVDTLHRMPERDRFLRGMVAWTGFVQTPYLYDRARRAAGTSKYPFWKMMRFALDGITAFTTIPLRLATWAGAIAALIALAGVVYAIFVRLFFDNWVPGWAAIFVAVAFFSGAQLIALGVIGEYLGRVFLEMKGRPLYIVADLSPAHAISERSARSRAPSRSHTATNIA